MKSEKIADIALAVLIGVSLAYLLFLELSK